jgi:hypothetical protein
MVVGGLGAMTLRTTMAVAVMVTVMVMVIQPGLEPWLRPVESLRRGPGPDQSRWRLW